MKSEEFTTAMVFFLFLRPIMPLFIQKERLIIFYFVSLHPNSCSTVQSPSMLNIKKYPFSVFCIALIWILSLLPIFPETPLNDVKFIDKWVHVIMYGGTFSVLWIEYAFKHKRPDYKKLFFWAILAPIVMSGILELLQEYCTGGHRNGDWLDLAANATGVIVAAMLGLILVKMRNEE